MQAMGRIGIRVLLAAVLVACNCAFPAAEPLLGEQEQEGYVESRRCEVKICSSTPASIMHGCILEM